MRVLIIDDDPDILRALSLSMTFRWPECDVITAQDGEEALLRFRQQPPDVVILDIGLPRISGLEVLRAIRAESSTPVLMLTARNQEADTVQALEMGADDYMSKPAGYLELTARIQSLLRRSQGPPTPVPALQTYSQGGLTINFPSRDVDVEGRSVPLTNTEYRLLYHLVRNAGRIVSHRELLQSAWGSDNYGEDVVRVYISRLRAKIEPDPTCPRYIHTKSGLGYLFTAAGDQSTRELASEERAGPTPDVSSAVRELVVEREPRSEPGDSRRKRFQAPPAADSARVTANAR